MNLILNATLSGGTLIGAALVFILGGDKWWTGFFILIVGIILYAISWKHEQK